jgi:hypothetical protein
MHGREAPMRVSIALIFFIEHSSSGQQPSSTACILGLQERANTTRLRDRSQAELRTFE